MKSGVDPRICHAKGSARAVGLDNGRRMGPRLEQNIRHYIEQGPGKHTSLDWDELHRGALPWLRRLPQRFRDELESLAEGADPATRLTTSASSGWSGPTGR
jgi:hypothetical protein